MCNQAASHLTHWHTSSTDYKSAKRSPFEQPSYWGWHQQKTPQNTSHEQMLRYHINTHTFHTAQQLQQHSSHLHHFWALEAQKISSPSTQNPWQKNLHLQGSSHYYKKHSTSAPFYSTNSTATTLITINNNWPFNSLTPLAHINVTNSQHPFLCCNIYPRNPSYQCSLLPFIIDMNTMLLGQDLKLMIQISLASYPYLHWTDLLPFTALLQNCQ